MEKSSYIGTLLYVRKVYELSVVIYDLRSACSREGMVVFVVTYCRLEDWYTWVDPKFSGLTL